MTSKLGTNVSHRSSSIASQCVCVQLLNHVGLFAIAWIVARLSMGFPRQEYWSGFPFPSLGDLPDPGTDSASPALVGGFFITVPPRKPASQILPNGAISL